MSVSRIVVVTNGNYFARQILERLLIERREQVVGIGIIYGDYAGRTGLRALWQVGRKTALPYLLYKVGQHLLFNWAQRRHPHVWFSVETMAHTLCIPFIRAVRVNSPEVREWVQQLNPTLGVSVSCPQRIRKPLLNSPLYGFINIHSSLLPQYAGLAPYFWVLAENCSVTGTTVHYMTEQFDEGNILSQRQLTIQKGTSAFELFQQLAFLGQTALLEAVDKAIAGDTGIPQEAERRSYRSHPTMEAYLNLRRNGYVLARWSELRHAIKGTIQHQTQVQQEIAYANTP